MSTVRLSSFAVVMVATAAMASDPFVPPVEDDVITSEVRADVENLRFRLRRAEETITDMEGFLIDLNQRVGGGTVGGAQPILVGQTDAVEYYRLPDGSIYIWEKGSEAPRPRASGMQPPPPPPPPEGAGG